MARNKDNKVSKTTILLGVGGTIYKDTMDKLKALGVSRARAEKATKGCTHLHNQIDKGDYGSTAPKGKGGCSKVGDRIDAMAGEIKQTQAQKARPAVWEAQKGKGEAHDQAQAAKTQTGGGGLAFPRSGAG